MKAGTGTGEALEVVKWPVPFALTLMLLVRTLQEAHRWCQEADVLLYQAFATSPQKPYKRLLDSYLPSTATQ